MKKVTLKDFAVTENLNFKECINIIMNSVYFRKLADKTQVIISLSGPNVRTRLTHTVEVAKIARDMCRDLKLNEDLAEAIALAHDIGHTPFGHVGERTLKEIMCKCDSLDNMIDIKIENFGFKHNLQSALLISEIFKDNKNIELKSELNYLFWGVAAHSSLTWTRLQAGLDNEILVHCKHCNKVFDCIYSKSNQDNFDNASGNICKFNLKEQFNSNEVDNSGKMCRPWVCARIYNKFKSQNDLLIKNFNQHTYCQSKCNFVDLWLFKMKNNENFIHFKYLFDFPFSNTYYAPHFNKLINEQKNNFVSFEAIVVNAADEIAQRRQDFEDGISLKLIKVADGARKLKKLIQDCKKIYKNKNLIEIKILNRINAIIKESSYSNKNSEIKEQEFCRELGDIIILFFKKIYFITIENNFKEEYNYKVNNLYQTFFNDFLINEKSPVRIEELYSSFNWENSLCDNESDKKNMIFFIVDYLDKLIKSNKLGNIDIHSMINKIDSYKNISLEGLLNMDDIEIIKKIQIFIDNDKVKEIFRDYLASALNKDKCDFAFDDLDYLELLKFLFLARKNKDYSKEKTKDLFNLYKTLFKSNANQGLMHFIAFEKEIDDCIEKFQDYYKKLILQSENVEKNDGKSAFIIKRLFKGYLSNPHQLPNISLSRIWNIYYETFLDYNVLSHEFDLIYLKLKKYFIGILRERELSDITWEKSIRKNNQRLYPKEINKLDEAKERLKKFLKKNNPEKLNKNIDLYEVRKIIDNPVLVSTSGWKQALYRGITDYIASLTDREALSEYEKLYFTTVEIG